jgi:hypothetical protein
MFPRTAQESHREAAGTNGNRKNKTQNKNKVHFFSLFLGRFLCGFLSSGPD